MLQSTISVQVIPNKFNEMTGNTLSFIFFSQTHLFHNFHAYIKLYKEHYKMGDIWN